MVKRSIQQINTEIKDRTLPLEQKAGRAISFVMNLVETEGKPVTKRGQQGKMMSIEAVDSLIVIKLTEKTVSLEDALTRRHSMRDLRGLYVAVFDPGVYPDDIVGSEEGALGLINDGKGVGNKVLPEVGFSIDTTNLRLRGFIKRDKQTTVENEDEEGETQKRNYLLYQATALRENSPVNGNDPYKVGYKLLIETATKINEALYGTKD